MSTDGEEMSTDGEKKPTDDDRPAGQPLDCCRNRCQSTFDDVFRARLTSAMSRLSHSEKRVYMYSMISLAEDERRGKKCQKPQAHRFQYTVKWYGIQQRVCQNAFIRLHGTCVKSVQILCRQMDAGRLVPFDARGRHKIPKVSAEARQLIKDHLFRALESPHVSRFAMKGLGELNRTKLWLDFKHKYVTGSSNVHIGKTAYFKYMNSFLTPEVLASYMLTQQAYRIHEKSQRLLKKRFNFKKETL